MERVAQFKQYIEDGYKCDGEYVTLGTAILDGKALESTWVNLPLKSLNRHGFMASTALVTKYQHSIDRKSAVEILTERMHNKPVEDVPILRDSQTQKSENLGVIEKISRNTLVRQVVRLVFREGLHALLKVLGIKSRRR